MNYKFAKVTIIGLLFLISLGGLAFAEESCSVLYNKQSVLINGYDKNQDKRISLEESYQALSAWYNNSISDAVLLDILKFSRQNCVIPSAIDNNTASGTLVVSSTQVYVGDTISLTVTGADIDGLYSLLVYYQGAWHSELVQGTTASKTFSFSESRAGTYVYFGYVYSKIPNGNLEFNWTEPKMVTVTVLDRQVVGPDLIISSVTTDPSSLATVDDVDFKVVIKNTGNQQMPLVSGGIITKVSSSSLPGSGYRICDAMTVRLQAGESTTIDCPIAQKLSQGNHDFTFFVDSSNKLTEGNENNNTLSKTIQITTGSGGQNDPISGTLSSSAKETDTVNQFVLSVTAQDDQGVDEIRMYYKGDWHTFDCAGQKSCAKTYQLSESTAGTYIYYAKVYGYDLNGNSENADTNPSSVRVVVTTAIVDTCTDSDGGANYYTYGQATPSSSAIEGRADCCKTQYSTNMGDAVNHIGSGGGECVSSGMYLYEAICQSGIPYMSVYACSNGCQDGVCR
ncbi:MAG: hypothetical protein NTY11_01390 [Candidatus Parcubacteria bacterium]|nr:hypothetical protein [Candidatus Parcubacteria bacterium]